MGPIPGSLGWGWGGWGRVWEWADAAHSTSSALLIGISLGIPFEKGSTAKEYENPSTGQRTQKRPRAT